MKTQIKRISKSTLAVVLSVCMLISCMTVGIIATDAAKIDDTDLSVGAQNDSDSVGAVPSIIYFKPGANWTNNSAKFGANFNKDDSSYTYLMMTEVPGNSGYYYVNVPSDKNKVEFTRIKDTATEATSSDTWTWGGSLDIPTDGNKNLFTRSTSGDGWETSGTWSIYDNDLAVPADVSFSDSSPTAAENTTTRLSWTCADSDKVDHYRIYKDGTILKDSNDDDVITSNLYYDIPAKHSSSGTYTVKAVPTDTISYTTSDASTGATLTVTRTNLATPTTVLSQEAVDVIGGTMQDTVTLSVQNYNDYEDVCNFTFNGTGCAAGSISNTGVYTISSVTSHYYGNNNTMNLTVALKSGMSEYYTLDNGTASVTTATKTLKAYMPIYSLTGNIDDSYLVGSTIAAGSYDYSTGDQKAAWWGAYHSEYPVATKTATPGIYSITIQTLTDAQLAANSHQVVDIGFVKNNIDGETLQQFAFRLNGTYYNKSGDDYEIPDMGVDWGDNLFLQVMDSNNKGGSLVLKGGTTYTFYIDQSQRVDANNPYGKIKVVTDVHAVEAAAKALDFNPTTGVAYPLADADDTIGTVSATPVRGHGTYTSTLKATVVNSDYDFAGWFTNAECTGTPESTALTYTATITDNVIYYGKFSKKTTAYTITLEKERPDGDTTSDLSITSGAVADGGKAYKKHNRQYECNGTCR